MKEMILKALVQGVCRADSAPRVCGWLKQLILAGPYTMPRYVCQPEEGELQGWLGGQPVAGMPGVEVCPRLAFRPLRCERVPSGGRGLMLMEWNIGLEVLPPVRLYRVDSLMQLLSRGIVPQRVVWQGEVLPLQSLGRQAAACKGGVCVVLDDELTRRLGLSFPAVHTIQESPLQQYRRIERQLRQLFAAGLAPSGLSSAESILSAEERSGEENTRDRVSLKGCPLSLCLQLQEVPLRRLHRVDEALQIRCFGGEGRERLPDEGCRKHGLWCPSAYSRHRLVMLYPQGAFQQARTLFGRLYAQSMLLPLWWQTDEAQWVAYVPGREAYGQLEEVLRRAPWTARQDEVTAYCLLVQQGREAQSAAGTPLDGRLRRVARLGGDCLLEPVPLGAVDREELAESLASQLLRLSVELGGLPWRLCPSPLHDAVPVLGVVAAVGHSPGESPFAFTLWNAEEGRCTHGWSGPQQRFAFQLSYALQEGWKRWAEEHSGQMPARMLVCLPGSFPQRHLPLLHQALHTVQPHTEVVLAHCRLTSGQGMLCIDPAEKWGVPAVGTCVTLLTGEHLLHGRAAGGRGGLRRAAPLAVRLGRLQASAQGGGVEVVPLPDTDRHLPLLLEQVCRSVWSNPVQTHGSAWPWVLSHASHLLRGYIRDRRDGLRY